MIDDKVRESIEAAFAAAQREPTADEIADAVTDDIAIAKRLDGVADIGIILPHVSRTRARIRADALAVAVARFLPESLPKRRPAAGGADLFREPTEADLVPTDADFDEAAELLDRARNAVLRRSGGAHAGDGAMLVDIARMASTNASNRAWRNVFPAAAETTVPATATEPPTNG